MYIYCILCIVLSCFLVKYKCIPCMLLLPFLQQPTTHQLHHQLQPSTIITTPLPPRWAPPAQGVGLTTWQSLSPFNPLCPSLLIHRCHRFRDSFQVSMPFFLFRFVDFFFLFSPSLEIRFFCCFFYLIFIWKIIHLLQIWFLFFLLSLLPFPGNFDKLNLLLYSGFHSLFHGNV